jgi:hypothetical protein
MPISALRLVAVKAPVSGLVAVTGLDIDRRDDPVARHLLLDAKDPVVTLCDVLACDEGEQFGRADTA